MTLLSVPKEALDAQIMATHPKMNVWVSANAGSGKTHVLSERVIRLLLNGTPPARILCLTYTKAAASVMQSRIFRTLSSWNELDDTQLTTVLSHLDNTLITPQKLAYARRLFSHALETPGGLKIQTIHAFCEALLHQFPLEANVPSHFEMLDETNRRKLLKQARCHLLERNEAHEALKHLLPIIGESTLDQLLNETIEKQHSLSDFFPFILSKKGEEKLRTFFGLDLNETGPFLLEKIKKTALFPPHVLKHYHNYGHVRARDIIAQFSQLAASSDETDVIKIISNIYFTKEGKLRNFSRLLSKKQENLWSLVQKEIEERQSALPVLLEKYQCTKLVTLNVAAFHLCALYLKIYTDLKKLNSLLDFDDLIAYTLHLLQGVDACQWVQYKLDRGLDHILLDEAQDTNPKQWKIIQLLAQEFFTENRPRTNIRTVFAVGDEKQSVYSFQGAAPENFAENGRIIQKYAQAVGQKFEKIQLNYSFRSTKDVLQSVDRVFEKPGNYKGLSENNMKTTHNPVRIHSPESVLIWDSIPPKTDPLPDDWRLTVNHLDTPETRLAETIAETIANWLQKGEILPAKGRLLRASDIMILVRKRDQFVPALSRALRSRNIPVTGSDRLQLTSHISVRDLIALARFVLQPQDDLSLACVLKSPLFALSEDDLYQLAAHRTGSLWQSLYTHASLHPSFEKACENLKKYRILVDKMPVFEFYSHILNNDKGRQKILARLGSEANEILDAFMDHALTIQKTGLPGLQAFCEILSTHEPEIKRELDQNHEEVRIMTVHAAKGLESAVVFLVDPGSAVWHPQHAPHFLEFPLEKRKIFIWYPNKKFRTHHFNKAISHLKEHAEQEYKRLLYVGMTRAEDRLILCGYRNEKKNHNTWLQIVKEALTPHAVPTKGPKDDIAAWRFSINSSHSTPTHPEMPCESHPIFPPIPDFLHHKMPMASPLPKLLRPSKNHLSIDDIPEPSLAQKRPHTSPVLDVKNAKNAFALEYGNRIHKLLQYLPSCDPEKRESYAQRYLNAKAAHWDILQQKNALCHIWTLLEDPHLKLLFSDFARSEVSLMGVLKIHGKEHVVSGKIDRLCITKTSVLFADFKTHTPPKNENDIPPYSLLQMALYRRLLQTLYPDKDIQALLIYSNGAKIYTLSPKKLDALLDNPPPYTEETFS